MSHSGPPILLFRLSRIYSRRIRRTLRYDFRRDHLKSALLLAAIAHMILALALPDLPTLSLSGFQRPPSLTVFLKQVEQEERFEQTLNQQLPLPAKIDTLADPSLGSTSVESGEDSLVSEAVEPSQKAEDDAKNQSSNGAEGEGDASPTIRFDYATVRLFAQQEAARYADLFPKKVERFARTFNRSRNIRRRTQSDSFRDRLGDLYARSNSSDGDICFKQERQYAVDEFTTNTVYFFRCDKQPQGLDLSKTNDRQSG